MKYLNFILISLFFFACSHQKTSEAPVVLMVDDFEKSQGVFDSVEFIPLETNSNCLLADISKIIFQNNFYYILDNQALSIFIFSETGKHIGSLNHVGQGPSEYIEITDFDMDKENNIYIHSAANRKLIKYLYPDYQKSEEYTMQTSFVDLAIDPKIKGIWQSPTAENSSVRYNPLAFYSEGKTEIKLEDREVFDDFTQPSKPLYFYRSNEYLFFNPNYSPYIYQLENGAVNLVAEIKSDRIVIPDDLNFNSDDITAKREFYIKNKIEGVEFFCKIKNYYAGVLRAPLDTRFFVYDIVTQRGRFIGSVPVQSYNTLTQNGDYLIGETSVEEYTQRCPQQSQNVSEDDNPILVKFKIGECLF